MMQQPIIKMDSDFEPFAICKGYRALFCEVIKMAIKDCLGVSNCGETPKELVRRRAFNWIYNPSTAARSFNWYCSLVDIDADCVRGILSKPDSRSYKRMLLNLKSTQRVYLREPRLKRDAE